MARTHLLARGVARATLALVTACTVWAPATIALAQDQVATDAELLFVGADGQLVQAEEVDQVIVPSDAEGESAADSGQAATMSTDAFFGIEGAAVPAADDQAVPAEDADTATLTPDTDTPALAPGSEDPTAPTSDAPAPTSDVAATADPSAPVTATQAPEPDATMALQTKDAAPKNGWYTPDEGASYYYYENGKPRTGWLVTGTLPNGKEQGLQRYWLGADGLLAVDRVVLPSEGNGAWLAYARPEGYVVRGSYRSGDTVYLANDEGKLPTQEGWVVTQSYGQGLQRYYVESTGNEAFAAIVGPSTKGWAHYTTPQGYVLRGAYRDGETVYLADNEGRTPAKEGWIVTQAYGQGLQRYYAEPTQTKGIAAAHVGPSTKGWAHYTTPQGYVLRGAYRDGETVYLADNEGRTPAKEGWIVTQAYGQGLQRYYAEPTQTKGIAAAHVGPSTKGWAHYTMPQGYVLRGTHQDGDWTYLANNDGRMPTGERWLVSKAYGQGIQRYYIEPTGQKGIFAAKVGPSTKGWAHYTTPQGYVVRGASKQGDYIYIADNDGRLPRLAAGADGKLPAQGWLITNKYTGAYERYYLYAVTDGVYAAKPGASTDGWAHFTRPEGYVVRGSYLSGNNVYLANNDGRMPQQEGWLISSAYGHDLQRYYLYKLKSGIYAARTGISADSYLHYTTNDGYVLRNALRKLGDKWYQANNDGLIKETVPVNIIQTIRGSLCHGPKGAEYQRYIVLHDTEGGSNAWNIIDGWEAEGNYVAAHFVINRDGTVVQCVPLDQIAHHAGFGDTGHNAYYGISESSRDDWRGTQRIGSWASDYGMNAWSIGIEMIHEGNQYYPQAQLVALDRLIAYIDGYYGFQSTIIDHKMWRSYNSDTSDAFAGYLANYRRTRTHNGLPL